MTGYDYQKLQTIVENCGTLNLYMSVTGDRFKITNKYGHSLGHFDNLDEVASYVYGYDAGLAMGRMEPRQVEKEPEEA